MGQCKNATGRQADACIAFHGWSKASLAKYLDSNIPHLRQTCEPRGIQHGLGPGPHKVGKFFKARGPFPVCPRGCTLATYRPIGGIARRLLLASSPRVHEILGIQ